MEPFGTAFTNFPNVTNGAFVQPGATATATFTGPPGNYHWQARAHDDRGVNSFWQMFSPNVVSNDFGLSTTVSETYTGAVGSFTVPPHVTKITVTAYGAQGGYSYGAGGLGGSSSGMLPVTPGATYYYAIGQQGGSGQGNGGGQVSGGGGGGMTWFSTQNSFDTSHLLLVAGGAGGGGGVDLPFTGFGGKPGGTGGYNGGGAGGASTFSESGTGGGGAGWWGGRTGGGGGFNQWQGNNGGTGGGATGGNGMGFGGGGAGGTQTSGYVQGTGQSGSTNFSDSQDSGGGGSGYISPLLAQVSSANGVNTGNGSLAISEQFDPAPSISSLNQFSPDATTSITEGSSTTQGAVTLSAALNSYVAYKLQLQVEVEPAGAAFTNIPNVTSSAFVAPGNTATTTFAGPNGSYHWQARAIDAANNASAWQSPGAIILAPPASTKIQELISTPLYNDPGLVSYYRFEGNANDGKGTNNGTAANITYGTNNGKFGQGANFDGNSSVIALPNIPISGKPITLSAWAYPTSISHGGRLISLWAGSGIFIGTAISGSTILSYALLSTSAGTCYSGTVGSLSLNAWNLVTATYDNASLNVYVNGTLAGTSSCSGSLNEGAFHRIGIAENLDPNQAFAGNIDDAAVFNRALEASEISNLYTGVTITSPAPSPVGPSATSTDFILAAPHINFTLPANGGTTPNFPNWQLSADAVSPTDTYQLQLTWSAPGSPLQVATSTATGADLIAGVSVPKTPFPGDTTLNGTPVAITANASLADANGAVIASTTVSFTEGTAPLSLGCGSGKLQCISYQYDNNGNITSIIDDAPTDAGKSVDYAYDPLNRLISASSSKAINGEDYRQTFSYDPVGNILTGPAGTYAYNGGASSGNPNPDAVASITSGASSTTFFYDPDGNLTSDSGGLAYTWDYNNRLISASSSNATSTYGYDFTGERIKTSSASSTIYDPEITYSTDGTTPTKHIFAAGALVSTIVGTSASSTAYTVLTDHLGGSSVILDSSGAVSELMDYYPYGSPRLDEKSGSYNEKRKYIGQQYDADTGLSYLNARYYNGGRGGFISQDPVFLAIGSQQLNQLIGGQLSGILSDPQLLNAYSYARDNPVSDKDPSGKLTASQTAKISATLAQISATLQNISRTLSSSGSGGSSESSHVNSFVGSGSMSNTGSTIGIANGGSSSGSFQGITGGGVSFMGVVAGGYQKVDPNFLNPAGFTRNGLLDQVDDPRLQNLVKNLFRAGDEIPGGTAGAVRYSAVTGEDVGGSDHIQKAQDYIRALDNYLSDPATKEAFMETATQIKEDLQSAVDFALSLL